MATHEIGIRIDPEKGIAFFGIDEVNARIAKGARVMEVRPGGAVMKELGEDQLTLAGCQIVVVLEDG